MNKQFSKIIAWGCIITLIAVPIAALCLLFHIELLVAVAKNNLNLSIQWSTVTSTQWYYFWFLSSLYIIPGLIGLYFLRRAFSHFAKGEFFNSSNSRDLRLFSIFLFIQVAIKPLHFSVSSILLSANHPAGQKMLSISFGSSEVKVIAIAMILWVMSDLLVSASQLENENKQFI